MVSLLHEGVIKLVRDRPAFVADLLGRVLAIDVPGFREARLAEATLNELVPVEYRADAVVVFTRDKPVFGVIIEAQLQADADKLFTWPLYAVAARERHRCPFVVLVVTPDRVTAAWAGKAIDLGGGVRYWPQVIGPDGIPRITDREQARREPQLAVLSVLAHGQEDVETASAIGGAAVWGIQPFPEEQRLLYSLLIEANLSEAARKVIDMQSGEKFYFTEAQRQNYERGRAQGKEEGWTQGKEEGRTQGKEEGRAEGQAVALLKILARRGLTLTADQHRQIQACTDLALLEQWLDRALTVSAADELFAK